VRALREAVERDLRDGGSVGITEILDALMDHHDRGSQ
jgi:hypothetical protein